MVAEEGACSNQQKRSMQGLKEAWNTENIITQIDLSKENGRRDEETLVRLVCVCFYTSFYTYRKFTGKYI